MSRMNRQTLVVEIIGWYGMLAIMAAYGVVSFDIVTSTSLPYQALNLTGAIALAVLAWNKRARPLIALNVIWAIIAVVALTQILF